MITMLAVGGCALATLCIHTPAIAVTAPVLYVDADAMGAGDGTSWTDAYTDLQDGINNANSGEEVWVAAGIYMPTTAPNIPSPASGREFHFSLKNGVAVYGGFNGTESNLGERNIDANETILSCDLGVIDDYSDNCYHVFYHPTGVGLTTSARLEDFTITSGNANGGNPHNGGGGMYNHNNSPTIARCIFEKNWAENGGGLHNWASSPAVTECSFLNNTANLTYARGGAVWNQNSVPVYTSCTFADNTAKSGGAIHNYDCNAVVTGSTFNNNYASSNGGAITNTSSHSTLTNCTFDSNSLGAGKYEGQAILNSYSNPIITNSTFVGHGNVGVYSWGNSDPIIKNCIFWNTSAAGEISNYASDGSTAVISYSVLYTGVCPALQGCIDGGNNLTTDPLLGTPGDNGGPVETISIGIGGSADNNGTATGAPATDARGVTRENPPDIGAYELVTHTVGGSVSGLDLANIVTLQNNGGDNLTVAIDGSFVFDSPLELGGNYAVTVLTQPADPKQICTVSNGSGTIGYTDITDVAVNCVYSYTVGGNVSGLEPGNSVVLQNNGGDNLEVTGNTGFTFSTDQVDESAYAVSVLTQPTSPSQTCTVTAGSGDIDGANITDVNVSCITNTYTVGGSVTGLATGNSVVLQNNGVDNLEVALDGTFTFATALDDESSYNVTVFTQPTVPNQTCTVTGGSGTLAGANIDNITVTCTTDMYSIGGTVTGLAPGNSVTLQNDIHQVTVNSNTTYALPNVTDGTTYNVTVHTQPTSPNQTCTVSNASGTIAGAHINDIDVDCVTNTYTVGGSVTGLFKDNSVTLQNNGGDDLIVSINGGFSFATPLDDESSYSVTVFLQPETTVQTCTVENGEGTLFGSDVSTVTINCSGKSPWTMFMPAILGAEQK